MKYTPTIGIETHVQLATKSKLFCGCDNDAREAAPNTKVCPVCLGFPGTLPVLNRRAVELAIRAGLALNGQIPEVTKFDRKNYFYPDLPKGYQITQLDQPIVGPGYVELVVGGRELKVGITRAHMEEDAGKLVHPAGVDYSLVDFNRAGTPLMEIVSEPDMHSAAEAKAYAQELYNLMRYAGVSEVNMYYGNMRFDVNVSVAPEGSDKLGTRSETKNLNSFRAVERAVEFEIKRQSQLLDKGEKVVQETRGWDEAKGQTFSQRSKEEAEDYRYFPEPDLPPVVVTDELKMIAGVDLITPNVVRQKLNDFKIPLSQAETLVANPTLARLMLEVGKRADAKDQLRIANWLAGEVSAILKVDEATESAINLTPDGLIELSKLVESGDLSSTSAKQVIQEMMATGDGPAAAKERLGLQQVSDSGQLEAVVAKVIDENPQVVADYKGGNDRALQALVGQVMKATAGQANPPMVNAILKRQLGN